MGNDCTKLLHFGSDADNLTASLTMNTKSLNSEVNGNNISSSP
jgi:hypothetical protein